MADLGIAMRLNRRMWRAFVRDTLFLLWGLATLAIGVGLVVVYFGSIERMSLGVVITAWAAWQGRILVRQTRSKVRALNSGIVTLRLTDLEITVLAVPGGLEPATLTWADCAAVVVSPAPRSLPGGPLRLGRYVQFVPVDESRIAGTPQATDLRPGLLGLSPTQALLAWVEIEGQEPGADAVVAWMRSRRPGVRLVGAAPAPT